MVDDNKFNFLESKSTNIVLYSIFWTIYFNDTNCKEGENASTVLMDLKCVDIFSCQRKMSTIESECYGEKETLPFFFIEVESSLVVGKCSFNVLGSGLAKWESAKQQTPNPLLH